MSDSNQVEYVPFQATPKAAVCGVLLIAALGGFELAMGGTLLPILPIPSKWHLMFWMLVFASPVLLLQLGWSYALEGREFVVRRFGTERHRVPLAHYVGRTFRLGRPTLDFGTRSFLLAGNESDARAAFFAELDRRLLETGSASSREPLPTQSDSDVTVRIDKVRFPGRCVCCGESTAKVTPIGARQALHFFFGVASRVATIWVPICTRHARAHARALWIAPTAAFFGATLVGTAAIGILRPETGGLAWIPGVVIGAVGLQLAAAFDLRRRVDAYVLGVSAVGLDPSRKNVTLRIRNTDLRYELMSQASNEAVARVFA